MLRRAMHRLRLLNNEFAPIIEKASAGDAKIMNRFISTN
jgi:hypothetical protein